jgi:hypothetical protein
MHDSPRQDRPGISGNAGSTVPKAQLLSRTSHRPRATFSRTVTQKQQIQPKRLRVHHFIGAESGRNQLCSALSAPPAGRECSQRTRPSSANTTSKQSRHNPPRNRKTASRRSLRIYIAKCSDAVWFHPLSAARTRSLSPRYGLRNSSAPGRSLRQCSDRRRRWMRFSEQRRDTQQRHCCSHPDTQCLDAYR